MPEMRWQTGAPADTPTQALLDVLRCLVCKGMLSQRPEELACPECQRAYPIVLGIPDLRVYEDPLIPLQDDYRKGEKIQAESERLSFAELVHYYWSLPTYPPTPADLRQRFTRHVLTDEQRIEGYQDKIGQGASFLDVGCGTAALVKVAQQFFRFAVGCDVAFRWLLIARKRLREAGLSANLVCCCADYLPFSENVFDTFRSPDPGVMSPVKAVMRSEIVWHRHLCKDFLDQPAGIESRAQWVPWREYSIHIAAKYVE